MCDDILTIRKVVCPNAEMKTGIKIPQKKDMSKDAHLEPYKHNEINSQQMRGKNQGELTNHKESNINHFH